MIAGPVLFNVLQKMKTILLAALTFISPCILLAEQESISPTVADMKRYLDAHLKMPGAKEIPDEELPKVFYSLSFLEGLITGLKIGDETHKPPQPILQRLDTKIGTKRFYLELRDFLSKSPLLKEQDDGLKASTWFLMTNYTDNITAKASATSMWMKKAESGPRE